jgi:hypothetical protein
MPPQRPRDLTIALTPTNAHKDPLALLKREPIRRVGDPPSQQRRLIPNPARRRVRQPELDHHLPHPSTRPKTRHNRRPLRRRQQPIPPPPTTPLRHPASDHSTRTRPCCVNRMNPPGSERESRSRYWRTRWFELGKANKTNNPQGTPSTMRAGVGPLRSAPPVCRSARNPTFGAPLLWIDHRAL